MKTERLEAIHESLTNGQRKQMVSQIDEYGLYDFWEDYKDFLYSHEGINGAKVMFDCFTDATISYFRIKNN